MVTIAIRLDPETKRKLEILSRVTGYQRAQIVGEAVRRFVETEYAALVALHEQEQSGAEEEGVPALSERWNIVV